MLKTSADVKALTYCGLQQLSSQGLAEVLRLYPEYGAAFRAGLPRDLTFNLRQGSDTNVCRPPIASAPSRAPFKADFPQPQRTSCIFLHPENFIYQPQAPSCIAPCMLNIVQPY